MGDGAFSLAPACFGVVLLFAVFAALVAMSIALDARRRRPPPAGRCQRCGYELTGNASGVCPEYGSPL